jgi:hypothetical protein
MSVSRLVVLLIVVGVAIAAAPKRLNGFARVNRFRASLKQQVAVRDEHDCHDGVDDLNGKLDTAAGQDNANRITLRVQDGDGYGHMLVFVTPDWSVAGADHSRYCHSPVPAGVNARAVIAPPATTGCTAFSGVTTSINNFIDCVRGLKQADGVHASLLNFNTNGAISKLAWLANDPNNNNFPGDWTTGALKYLYGATGGGNAPDDVNKRASAQSVYDNCVNNALDANKLAFACQPTLFTRPGVPGNGIGSEDFEAFNAQGEIPNVVFGHCDVPSICGRLAVQKLLQFNRMTYSATVYIRRELDSVTWASCTTGTTSNCRLWGGCFVQAMERVCGEHAQCCPGADAETRTAMHDICAENPDAPECIVCPVDNEVLQAHLPSALKQAWVFLGKLIGGGGGKGRSGKFL